MAHFHRLIFCCFVGLLSWLPSSSFANISTVPTPGFVYAPLSDTSEMGLCVKIAAYHAPPPKTISGMTASGGNCSFSSTAPGGYPQGNTHWYSSGSVQSCPSNSVPSGSSCVCSSGYGENGNQTACLPFVDPKVAFCKTLAGMTVYMSAPGRLMPGQTVCGEVGCNITMSSLVINYVDKTTGMGVGQGDGVITASPCTFVAPTAGSPTPAASAATVATPSNCVGGAVGSVNGLQICVPYDPAKNTVESVKTSTGSSTATGPSGAASSATSSSSSTTCLGSSCTTTTSKTTTPGDGGVATTTTDKATESKPDFCVKNPTDLQCKAAQSSFGGVCGSAPSCSGDAVMCAVAAATFTTNCKLISLSEPDPDSSSVATAARNGSDGINTEKMKIDARASAVQISNFDVSGKGWSRSCPADPVIPIPWGSITSWTLPLSRLCSPLQILANAVVGITLLASLVWVIGGRKT